MKPYFEIVAIMLICSGCATGSASRNILADPQTHQETVFFRQRFEVTEDIPVRYPYSWNNDNLHTGRVNRIVPKKYSDGIVAWVRKSDSIYSKTEAEWFEQNPQYIKRGTIVQCPSVYENSDWFVFWVFFLFPIRTEYEVEVQEIDHLDRCYVIYQGELSGFQKLPWVPIADKQYANGLDQ